MKKRLLKTFTVLLSLGIVAILLCLIISDHVVKSTEDKIVDSTDLNADCIVVLGAKVRDGEPSLMLRDRLDRAIGIHFDTGIVLLMSGDHSSEDYNEVEVMKNYAVSQGVAEENILTDPEGYSTLETITRLDNFGFDSAIVVTQKYHVYRALYICEKRGVEAVGIPAEDISYYGEEYRLLREIVARTKDFFYTLFV